MKMNTHFKHIQKRLLSTRSSLLKDAVLRNDIDFDFEFVAPYSGAKEITDVKLIVIGQDPTVRRVESRKDIHVTLNLDKKNSLKRYLQSVCEFLHIDIENEVYATNLYKCFFKIPPADDQTILTRHFKTWMDLLVFELNSFTNSFVVTLGEPVIRQLIHSDSKKVNHYWAYVGNTQSDGDFKCCKATENYLNRRINPIAHQPTWSQNKFYNKYLENYLEFLRQNEQQIL